MHISLERKGITVDDAIISDFEDNSALVLPGGLASQIYSLDNLIDLEAHFAHRK
ncbi:MAG TPA: hypothetical protein VHK86_02915 [Nitrososphaera sp.]|nr:hypothetical protein [Nitrososphaera sp.]